MKQGQDTGHCKALLTFTDHASKWEAVLECGTATVEFDHVVSAALWHKQETNGTISTCPHIERMTQTATDRGGAHVRWTDAGRLYVAAVVWSRRRSSPIASLMILYTDISNEVVMYELYVYRVFQNRSAMHWGRGDSGGNWDKNVNKTRCAEFPKLMSVVTPSLNHTVLFSLRTTFAQEPG